MGDRGPTSEDVMLLRRARAGKLAAAGPTMVVRLAWIHVRRWPEPTSTVELCATLGLLSLRGPVLPLNGGWLARRVRQADDQDEMPARTSAEFVWRHPELVGCLPPG